MDEVRLHFPKQRRCLDFLGGILVGWSGGGPMGRRLQFGQHAAAEVGGHVARRELGSLLRPGVWVVGLGLGFGVCLP